MRTTRTTRLSVAAVAALAATAATAIGTATPATALSAPATETHRERGVVLECRGTDLRTGDHEAYVALYENDVFGNYVQVVLDDDPAQAASREPADIVRRGDVRVGVQIRGKRARVVGNLGRLPGTTRVHEEHDDGGRAIVIDGTHRRLVHDLGLLYRGRSYQLTCDPAFAYDLQVTTSDATGDPVS